MTQLIRDAIDFFLAADEALQATFGSAPQIAAHLPSRSEWPER